MEPTDLQAENRIFRFFKQFSQEATAVSIARFAGMTAVLAALMALLAWNDAKEARISVETELRLLREDIRNKDEHMAYLESLWVALRADLEAQGYVFPEDADVRAKVQGSD